MKIFSCYTRAHEALLQNYFAPSLPSDFQLHATLLEGSGRGDFLSIEFIECIHRKIDLILASLQTYSDEVLVWSDVDIVFFRCSASYVASLLAESGKDILFQREGKATADVNAGFFVCRANQCVIAFFEKVRTGLLGDRTKNEQYVVNELSRAGAGVQWSYLPWTFYARTHGWPPPSDIALYHANETPGKNGVAQKFAQFEELQWVRKYGAPALAWSCITKIPKRLKRVLRKHFGG